MEELFVPYKESLALKELGFDEVCLSFYFQEKGRGDFKLILRGTTGGFFGIQFPAPLYQQAFKWFREKHSLWHLIEPFKNDSDDIVYAYDIILEQTEEEVLQEEGFSTYEEAELECLRKLIEIVKNK